MANALEFAQWLAILALAVAWAAQRRRVRRMIAILNDLTALTYGITKYLVGKSRES